MRQKTLYLQRMHEKCSSLPGDAPSAETPRGELRGEASAREEGERFLALNEGERFLGVSRVLKERFGTKVVKLSIDGGFTCPNRDGSKGWGGCVFCSASGSGDFTSGRSRSISEQMEEQARLLSNKWKATRFIAYFQNFSNTYASAAVLREKYDEALRFPNVAGLAVATRPDCINEEIGALLAEYDRRTFFWAELGIQSTCERTAEKIRRGYGRAEMDNAFRILKRYGIRVVAHIILNLPGESERHYAETLKTLTDKGIWGIKIHMLNILKNTELARRYLREPFALASREEYIGTVCDLIEKMPPNLVIHRLTGDGAKSDLIAPQWILNKRAVLNGIQKELRRRGSFQGKHSYPPAETPE